MRAFKETIHNCNLVDLGYVGHKFTWFNKQKKNPILERLDRFLANDGWIRLFPHNFVTNLLRMSSDHNPLLLQLEQKKAFPGTAPFRFEPLWLTDPDFIPFVSQKWNSYPPPFQQKLNNLANDLKPWAANLFSNNQAKKKRLIARINENTVNIESTMSLQEIDCSSIPLLSETKEALFSIGPDKAPGLDGFHAAFYHAAWDYLKQDCLSFVQQVFSQKAIPDQINKTIICLIPKIFSPSLISSYRPISLVNTSYKIISKILVHRIRPHLLTLISPNQNSFLKGRGTEVNYIIASEIMHSMKKKGGTRGLFAIKLDLEKAYDKLE
uniref:Reverse transcriptase domain-containing protein n=1 Tax=Chenopodium quinoa TaxID=63459 RepID=A0A803LHF9_CHEQI